MKHDGVRERERALEEAFFAAENERRLARLRSVKLAEVSKHDLAQATGINDPAVLDELVEAGVRTETLAAFALVPLVRVAWATGRIQGPEREAVLRAAVDKGLREGGEPYGMLEHWLHEQPANHLYETWDDYARALVASLDPDRRAQLRKDLLERAREVARAARNFAGIGPRVSPEEEQVLEELERVLAG